MPVKDQNVVLDMKNHMRMPSNKLKTQYRPLVLALQAALATGVALPSAPSWAAQTTRVSISSAGVESNLGSSIPAVSADGRFVAFSSSASNLVASDTNGQDDIFVRDQKTKQTTRVSISSAGAQGNYYSFQTAISADGRFVAFSSSANNLVANDANVAGDIFVRDRQTNQTTRVSVSSAGVEGGIYLYSRDPAISADGRFVAFSSRANNLVAGDTNDSMDAFVHDRQTKQTTRISLDSAGIEGNLDSSQPSISADGRFVAFTSSASNLVTGDTNLRPDIFVRDRQTNQTTRVSVSSAGVQSNYIYTGSKNPAISADGRFVAFSSSANDLVTGDTNRGDDIFVRDRLTNQTTRVSVFSTGVETNRYSTSFSPTISADGRFVAFVSNAKNLVIADTNNSADVFVRDRLTSRTTRVSLSNGGIQANLSSLAPSINADGRYVAFVSADSNLIADDTNNGDDIFVRDLLLAPAITADLTLTQTVSANPVTVGASFSYTATVNNQGPGNAANVV